ncbi:MAG: hypothetical protein Q9161_009692 [Pseudevernia consocians]
MTILVIAQEITQAAGVYCATSRKIQFAHVWANERPDLKPELFHLGMCNNGRDSILWSDQAPIYATKAIAKAAILQINCVPVMDPDGIILFPDLERPPQGK